MAATTVFSVTTTWTDLGVGPAELKVWDPGALVRVAFQATAPASATAGSLLQGGVAGQDAAHAPGMTRAWAKSESGTKSVIKTHGGVDLLTNASSTSAEKPWPGGRGTFEVSGTFGGATVYLQYMGPDGSTWLVAGANTTLTAAGGGNFDLPEGRIRALVSGGSPSGLYASALPLEY